MTTTLSEPAVEVDDLPAIEEIAKRALQEQLPPRDRIDTLPAGKPEFTLGLAAIAWIYDNLRHTDGIRHGQPFLLTDRQKLYVIWYYAVNPDGSWMFDRGVTRQAKGFGKSPFAAALALFELLGPCRVDYFDPQSPGGVVGKPEPMPLVQIAAVAESQTRNTMKHVLKMAAKHTDLARKYRLDTMKTAIDVPETGGRLEQIASSSGAAEGSMVTFAVADETEHWYPSQGGKALMDTLIRNAAKSGNRVMETSNAWTPGGGSIAEEVYEAWCLQEEDQLVSDAGRILYDAVIAPANTSLRDEPKPGEYSLTEALSYVYASCPWQLSNLKNLKKQILMPTTPVSVSRGFYLNQPAAADSAWLPAGKWTDLADPSRRLVPGERVVMFFDGSKSKDHSALVGCCMSDGHVFTVGVWDPADNGGTVDVEAIQGAVTEMRSVFDVKAFWADVREFESYVKDSWPEEFSGTALVPAKKGSTTPSEIIAWDMRSHARDFAAAAELVYAEVMGGRFTHDGHKVTASHVANARLHEQRGHYSIRKESQKSPKKIDAAVCVIGARMLYHHARAEISEEHLEGFRLENI